MNGLTVTNPNVTNESAMNQRPSNIAIVMDKRIPGSYKCPECEQTFKFKDELRGHKKTQHQVICPECGKLFSNKGHLKDHELIHSGVRPFICDTCGKGFTKLGLLNSHAGTHR